MKRCLAAILLLLSAHAFTQSSYYANDAQVWSYLTLQKKVNDRFSIQLKIQDRFTNNITQFDRLYADASVIFRATPDLRFQVNYRIIEKSQENGNFSTRHRYKFALIYKKDIQRWKFIYRNLLQVQYNEPFTSETGSIPYWYDRNRLTIRYELNKYLDLYTAEEIYIPLNSPQATGIERARTYLGILYNTFKKQQLDVHFLYQAQMQSNDWFRQRNSFQATPLQRDFIVGIGYTIQF